jgi:hypothetical protein
MDLDFGKVAVVGAGLLIGAIGGAWIWAQRAAAIAHRVAQAAGEDAMIEAARNVGTSSLGAALQGAMFGGILGLIAAGAYLYFTDPDRGMRDIKTEDEDSGKWS